MNNGLKKNDEGVKIQVGAMFLIRGIKVSITKGVNEMNRTTVTILQTSDIHGQLFPIHYSTNKKASIGLACISTMVKQLHVPGEPFLLIDNGDLIQGTPFMFHYMEALHEQINPMIVAANDMGYAAAVFGNHEFSFGRKRLDEAIEASVFPWISATIINEDTGEPYYGKPYIMKEYTEGLRVAVLGLTTSYIEHWENEENVSGMKFISAVEAAKIWVPYLREEQGADVVVVSYHGGFERDIETGEAAAKLTGENEGYALCMEVPGIDVLLTGHQHREIADKQINGVEIVQPGRSGNRVSKVTIELTKYATQWRIESKKSELLGTEGVTPDEEMLYKLEPYENTVQAWLDEPLGEIQGDLRIYNPFRLRLAAHSFIEFINKVQMDATDAKISNTPLFNNKVPGFSKQVTMRDVMANYIYPNTLKVLKLSGQDIRDALEQSARYFEQYDGEEIKLSKEFSIPKPKHSNYDMWAGIEYELNVSRPVGERVTKLLYEGEPLQMDGTYDVVMNSYRAGGGADYDMYLDKPVVKEIQIDMSELIANYFRKYKVVNATCKQNWRVVYDSE